MTVQIFTALTAGTIILNALLVFVGNNLAFRVQSADENTCDRPGKAYRDSRRQTSARWRSLQLIN